jgi:uncharacterized membrane protein
MNLEKFKTFIPTVPLATSAVTLFNTASARDYFGRGPGWGDFLSLLISLLFIALLVLAVLYLFQLYRSRQTSTTPPSADYQATGQVMGSQPTGSRGITPEDSALTILRERLAKGDISVEDYEARRRVLLETK